MLRKRLALAAAAVATAILFAGCGGGSNLHPSDSLPVYTSPATDTALPNVVIPGDVPYYVTLPPHKALPGHYVRVFDHQLYHVVWVRLDDALSHGWYSK